MMYAVRFLKFYASAFAVVMLASCSPKQSGSSSIKIVLPTSAALNSSKPSNKAFAQNVSSMAFDATKDCFAVNVTGPSIPQVANSCAPAVGVFSGFQPGGSTVTLSVPMGSARKVEVFYFQRALATDSCPTDLSSVTPDKIALLGAVSGIEMNQPEVSVSLHVTAPAATDNLITQNIVSNSCVAAVPTPGAGNQRLVVGSHKATSGGGYSIEGQVTATRTMNEISSPSGHKMFLGPKGL